MSTSLIVTVLGAIAGLAAVAAFYSLRQPQPQLRESLDRLHPSRTTVNNRGSALTVDERSLQEKTGDWIAASPVGSMIRLPRKDLALAGIEPQKFLGEKALCAAFGFAFPWLMTVMLAALGVALPLGAALIASAGLAVALFFWPNIELRKKVTAGRVEFARALSTYIDLVALERVGGAGTIQALEQAASIGDGPVFNRLREELDKARWQQRPPWDAFNELADELSLPELADLADIMRMSGSGASVYDSLRARSAGIRSAILSKDKAAANQASERMNMPTAGLCVVFMLMLIVPFAMRLI